MALQSTLPNIDRAASVLGVSASATEQELRAAYLKKVQEFPPDRDPELFEKIRDAYDQLRNPAVRAQAVLLGPERDIRPLGLLDGLASRRAFAGPQLWIELLKEKRT